MCRSIFPVSYTHLSLRNASSVEEFLNIIDQADEEQKSIDERLSDTGVPAAAEDPSAAPGFRLLAVTSCPTGIAHTYMAAEGIEKAAREKGCAVKIETRGSGGAKNVLTEEEIREADCIIGAADAHVPMDRFDGKKAVSYTHLDVYKRQLLILSRLVDTFFSRISLTTLLHPKPHNTAYVLP